jgi:hypothetical protein
MTKEKKRIIFPLIIIMVILAHCWTIILTTEILAIWRHYIGLVLSIVIIFLFFKNLKATTVATGLYLLLATFNLIAFTPSVDTYGIRFSESISTPPIQLLSLGLFILYLFLNLDSLINIHLDIEERKLKRTQKG